MYISKQKYSFFAYKCIIPNMIVAFKKYKGVKRSYNNYLLKFLWLV